MKINLKRLAISGVSLAVLLGSGFVPTSAPFNTMSSLFLTKAHAAASTAFNQNEGLDPSIVSAFGGGFMVGGYDSSAIAPVNKANWTKQSQYAAFPWKDGSTHSRFLIKHENNSFVNTQHVSVAADGTVYSLKIEVVATNGEGSKREGSVLYAYKPTGELKWRTILPMRSTTKYYGVEYYPSYKSGSTVIGKDGTIYVSESYSISYRDVSYVTAINPNGTVKWTYDAGWSSSGDQKAISSPAIDSQGNIYFVTSGPIATNRGYNITKLVSLTPAGVLRWNYSYGQASPHEDISGNDMTYPYGLSSPIITPDGKIVFIDPLHDQLIAVNQSGAAQWSKRLSNYTVKDRYLTSTPVVDEAGNIYIGGDVGIYAFDSGGNLKWNSEDREFVATSIAISKDGYLYYTVEDKLKKLDRTTGKRVWEFEYNSYGRARSDVLIDKDGIIYYVEYMEYDSGNSAEKGTSLVAVYPDGTLKGRFKLGVPFKNTSTSKYELNGAVSGLGPDGTLYVSDHNGTVYGIGPNMLPSNQQSYNDHLMKLNADLGTSASIAMNKNFPSDIKDIGASGGNMVKWQISTDGLNFTDVGVSYVANTPNATIGNLDPNKGYYIRTIYSTRNDFQMVYQRMILRPDKYTGLPLPSAEDFKAPQGQPPYQAPITVGVTSPSILESDANDGSFTAKQVVTVTGGTLAQDLSTGVTVNNLPVGLATSVTRLSDTQFEIAFTGKATNHANASDVANASVTVAQDKIVGATGAVTSGVFSFDFKDPAATISMQYPTIKESGNNDGALGSMQSILLTNGTFTTDAASGVTITGLPPGITASVSKWSDTQLNISFAGKATNHANANDTTVNVTIDKGKVTGATANLTGSFRVDFDDPPITIELSNPVVPEANANDGSITTKQVVTLQNGGTFTADAASATQVTNLPSGITVSVYRLSDKQLEITFLGKATNHANSNDKTDVLIMIPQSKVVGASGALIKTFKIDFFDPSAKISSSKSVLVEDAANDGSVTDKQVITLQDGTFATDVVSGTSFTNVPAGLTANVVRLSDTQLEISFSGRATAHENNNDVSNVQVSIDKTKVANALTNLTTTFGIDFQDAPAVFEVSNLQAVVVNDTVNLSWNAADGADSYIVERYADGVKEKARTITTTTFVDDTVVSGMNYEYRVTPKKGTEIGSPKSVNISTPIDLEDGGETDPTYGGEPQVGDDYSIRIPLDIPGAVRYEVIRNGTEVYDGPGPEFVDKNLQAGVTYRYKVIGYDADGNPIDSENKDVKIEDQTVQNLKATDIQKDSVTLTFDAINGASNYIIERYKDGQLEKRSASYTNSFTDLTVTANTAYVYKVKAVINGNQTVPASVAVKTLGEVTDPVVNTVTVTTSDVTHKSVKVSWSSELRYDKVVVTRDGQVVYTGAPASSWYFADNNLDSQTTYEYTVEVYDSKGNVTGKETVSVTTQQEPPAEAGDENFYASDVQFNKVTLTWKPIDGASYYMLYRFNGTKQEFAKIVYAPKISFTDSTVGGGITYKYKLVPKVGTKFTEPMELQVTTKSADLPVAPTLNSVKVDNGVVKVTATNNDSAASLYVVITDENGVLKARTAISSGYEKVFKNLAAGTYSVKVEAYNRSYRTSSYSAPQSITLTPEMVLPPVPQNLNVTVTPLDSTFTLIKTTVDAINDPEVTVYFYLYAADGKLVSNAVGKTTTDGKIGWDYRAYKANLLPGQYKVVTKSLKFSKYSELVEKVVTVE